MTPRLPRCPVTGRVSFTSESEAAKAAAARDPLLDPTECLHCPHWHYQPRPSAARMTRLARAVISVLLSTPGPTPRDQLRDIAYAHSNQDRRARAGGGRRSTNELRGLLVNLERDNLVIRSESTVSVVDAEALRSWSGIRPRPGPEEEAPCPSSSPPEDS